MTDPRIPSAEREIELRSVAETGALDDAHRATLFGYKTAALREAIAWAYAERERADMADRLLQPALRHHDDRHALEATMRPRCVACESQPNDVTPCPCTHAPCVHDTNRERARADVAEASLDAASRALGAVIMAALPLAPGEERVPGPEDEHAAVQAVLGVVAMRARAQGLLADWAAQMDGAHEHGSDCDGPASGQALAGLLCVRASFRLLNHGHQAPRRHRGRASMSRWDELEEALDALDDAENERDAVLHWEDADDEWTAAADAAFPARSGSHKEYGIAMKMVGNRHSKGNLVELVNWLLVERGELAAHILQQSAAVPTVWDHSCRQCVSCSSIDAERIVDGFACGRHRAQRIAKGGT